MEALVRQRPTSPAALGEIKGLGRARIDRYGDALLEAVAGAPAPTPVEMEDEPVAKPTPRPKPAEPSPVQPTAVEAKSKPRPTKPEEPTPSPRVTTPAATQAEKPPAATLSPPPSTASDRVSTEEWTWRLVDRGFSIEEAAAIRGLDASVVARHLVWMVRRGKPLDPSAIAPAEVVAEWDAWMAEHPEGEAPAEPADRAHLWPLFRVCRTGR
ncbi:HRDC domain protein [Planctomyces sp. SH-PL62]|nr:HRDC domain protein [Planctomyces sp. SH-PL62]